MCDTVDEKYIVNMLDVNKVLQWLLEKFRVNDSPASVGSELFERNKYDENCLNVIVPLESASIIRNKGPSHHRQTVHYRSAHQSRL